MEKQDEENQNTMQSPGHFRYYKGVVIDGTYLVVLFEALYTMVNVNYH